MDLESLRWVFAPRDSYGVNLQLSISQDDERTRLFISSARPRCVASRAPVRGVQDSRNVQAAGQLVPSRLRRFVALRPFPLPVLLSPCDEQRPDRSFPSEMAFHVNKYGSFVSTGFEWETKPEQVAFHFPYICRLKRYRVDIVQRKLTRNLRRCLLAHDHRDPPCLHRSPRAGHHRLSHRPHL